MRIQRSHQHETLAHKIVNASRIRFYADGTIVIEALAGVANQLCAGEDVVDHHGFEDIELELSVGA